MPFVLTGTLGPDRRPTIAVGIEGRKDPLICVVDTGFNGKIWVPEQLSKDQVFEPVGSEYLGLADGSVIAVALAMVTIDWFGQAEALSAIVGGAGDPPLGTALLVGCRLEVDFVEGSVRVERLLNGTPR